VKRPAFQFYAKDWRGNLKLRRCSDAAKGAWIEIMCVLHDSEEYGVARFPLKELVNAAGVQLKSAKELVEKGVLKGGDKDVKPYIYTPRHAGKDGAPVTLVEASTGPMWYCSRFVRDEYKRKHAGAETRFKPTNPSGGSPPDPAPPRREGTRQGDGSAVASASAIPESITVSRNTSTAHQAVDNPRPDGRKGNPPKVSGDTPAQARLRTQGWRKGLTPGTNESWDAFRERVNGTREAA
jgi:hypothetical protein